MPNSSRSSSGRVRRCRSIAARGKAPERAGPPDLRETGRDVRGDAGGAAVGLAAAGAAGAAVRGLAGGVTVVRGGAMDLLLVLPAPFADTGFVEVTAFVEVARFVGVARFVEVARFAGVAAFLTVFTAFTALPVLLVARPDAFRVVFRAGAAALRLDAAFFLTGLTGARLLAARGRVRPAGPEAAAFREPFRAAAAEPRLRPAAADLLGDFLEAGRLAARLAGRAGRAEVEPFVRRRGAAFFAAMTISLQPG